ncbi:hypothetical protein Tsubulata_015804 [Turnera subulata]|uniref:KIB1-4 beta-propeller domain-containing protein n=1 Tax=Turnera subulata TaxID=218843 RepID=A0A9Q0F8L8_9ROSI|nr:hypothetical protein Tsubulata_015804 [Turnera subulata]
MPMKRTRPPSSSISKRRKIDGPSIKAPAVLLASKGNTPTRPPCLMLLPGDREGQEQSATGCVLTLDKSVHDLTNMGSVIGGDYSWVCVGSSHGWLMLFYGDKAEGHMFLLNPSFLTPNLSPPLFYFPSISGTAIKAILLSDPSIDEEFGAVAIYKHNTGLRRHPNHTKIAFYKHGDDQWSDLGVAKGLIYCDIMCHNNHLYALTDCGSIEVWDLHGSDQPEKIRDIKPSATDKMIHTYQTRKDLYSHQLYLVESSGEILLVERYRGYCVDPEGSHSTSLSTKDFPECKSNAIYFSDDNWDQMDEDFLYGGHDFGVFDLKKRTKKPLDGFKYDRMVPPPVWVVPNIR